MIARLGRGPIVLCQGKEVGPFYPCLDRAGFGLHAPRKEELPWVRQLPSTQGILREEITDELPALKT